MAQEGEIASSLWNAQRAKDLFKGRVSYCLALELAVKDEVEVSKLEKVVSASIDKDVFQCLLWSESAVPVEPAACMEAVTHHALGKQKEDNCQDDYEQELSYAELWWHSSGRGGRIRVSRHRGCLSAMSGACQGTAIPNVSSFSAPPFKVCRLLSNSV